MTERPILFNTDMVRAIRDGHKTMTRRPVTSVFGWNCHEQTFLHTEKHRDPRTGFEAYLEAVFRCTDEWPRAIRCPFGLPGDRLWVRETFYPIWREDHSLTALYRADGITLGKDKATGKQLHWKPAIHMPRKASRLTLEITGIGVERVQAITEADAKAEGVGEEFSLSYRGGFANMWNSLYGSRGYGWDENPWVWVVRFKLLGVFPGER